MPPEKTRVQEFFDGLSDGDKQTADIFDDKTEKTVEKTEEKGTDADDEPRKNRRHRRLESQLEKERDLRIAAEARAEALAENGAHKRTKGGDEEIDRRLIQAFGGTEENLNGIKLVQEVLADYSVKAKEEAIAELESRQIEARREQAQFESFIDSELEAIEDDFNVDVTSDAPAARKARREFLELVQTLSPKDKEGTIVGYADFGETWKMYQLKRGAEKPRESAERNKDLASRSMEKSSSGATGEKKPTPGFFGWKKDLNL